MSQTPDPPSGGPAPIPEQGRAATPEETAAMEAACTAYLDAIRKVCAQIYPGFETWAVGPQAMGLVNYGVLSIIYDQRGQLDRCAFAIGAALGSVAAQLGPERQAEVWNQLARGAAASARMMPSYMTSPPQGHA